MEKITHIYETTEPECKVEIINTPEEDEDVITTDQLVTNFYTFAVACTYSRNGIVDAMREFVKAYDEGFID